MEGPPRKRAKIGPEALRRSAHALPDHAERVLAAVLRVAHREPAAAAGHRRSHQPIGMSSVAAVPHDPVRSNQERARPRSAALDGPGVRDEVALGPVDVEHPTSTSTQVRLTEPRTAGPRQEHRVPVPRPLHATGTHLPVGRAQQGLEPCARHRHAVDRHGTREFREPAELALAIAVEIAPDLLAELLLRGREALERRDRRRFVEPAATTAPAESHGAHHRDHDRDRAEDEQVEPPRRTSQQQRLRLRRVPWHRVTGHSPDIDRPAPRHQGQAARRPRHRDIPLEAVHPGTPGASGQDSRRHIRAVAGDDRPALHHSLRHDFATCLPPIGAPRHG